jgi:hypothetical protein
MPPPQRFGIDFGSGKPVKASIYNEETKRTVVECMFNPSEYTLSKANKWGEGTYKLGDAPLPNFDGTTGMKLDVNNLIFDTYVRPSSGPPEDVRDYTDKLFELMKVEPKTQKRRANTPGRPPRVSFRCGRVFSFKAVITNVTQVFTLFWEDGRPVRAKVNISFLQVESSSTFPAQNPTSMGQPQKVRVVGPGETIDAIAYAELGDASLWRLLAEYNGLDDPLRLRAGQRLAIPGGG